MDGVRRYGKRKRRRYKGEGDFGERWVEGTPLTRRWGVQHGTRYMSRGNSLFRHLPLSFLTALVQFDRKVGGTQTVE